MSLMHNRGVYTQGLGHSYAVWVGMSTADLVCGQSPQVGQDPKVEW